MKSIDSKFLCVESNLYAPLWAWIEGDMCQLCIPLTQKELDAAIAFAERIRYVQDKPETPIGQ